MKKIIIKTQKDLDDLPVEFKEFTCIEIRSTELIRISLLYKNAKVSAYGSSQVSAYDSSRVTAYDSSQVSAYYSSQVSAYGSSRVTAYDSSQVSAYDSSQVTAYDSSKVTAYDSSQVSACGSSQVTAYGSSQVSAYYSSQVSAYGSSQVTAYYSSQVSAYGSSQVTAYDSSKVTAYLLSCVLVHSEKSEIKAYDNSRLVLYEKPRIKHQDASVNIIDKSDIITPTFDQWIERGIVYADNIYKKYLSHKTIGQVTIYEVTEMNGEKTSYVARKGGKFAHGETIEQATKDLRYKISDRDTSKYENWKLTNIKPVDELIEAYITITGACSSGTKMFCEEGKIQKEEYSIKEVIELTKGRFGNEVFEKFFINRGE